MSRTARFVGGVTFGYLNLALVTLVGLWLTPFLIRHLGAHSYGLWLLSAQIVSYLLLIDFGVMALLPREVAYAAGRSGPAAAPAALSGLLRQVRTIVRWQTSLLAGIAAGVWLLLPADWAALRGPLLLVLAVLVVTFPLRVWQALLQGLQELAFLGRSQLGAWGGGTVIAVLLVLGGWGLYGLAAGWAVTQVALVVASRMKMRRAYGGVGGGVPTAAPPHGGVAGLLGQSSWVSLSQLAQVLLNATDMLIIARFINPAAVVAYAVSAKLVAVMTNLPQVLTQSAAPALSEMRATESRERLRQTMTALTLGVMSASGLIACLVLLINEGFVGWWVGAGLFEGMLLTGLLVGNMLLRHWNTAVVYGLFSFGRQRRISLTTIVDGIVTVSMSIWLVRRFGLVGAPLGSLAGVALVSLPSNLSALSRETGTSPAGIVADLRPWLWRFALLGAATAAASLAWRPSSLPGIAATTLVVTLVYGAVMLSGLLRTPLGAYLGPRLQGAWTRRLRSVHLDGAA